jgi:lactate dehydrogenase-like 2-hydroxyacid dehydrogenase
MASRSKVVCTFSPPDRNAIIKDFPELDIRFPANSSVGATMSYEELFSTIGDAVGLVHAQATILMTKEVISSLPAKLKIIANHGAGYDGFDVSAATNLGFWVTNTPLVVNSATADIAMSDFSGHKESV